MWEIVLFSVILSIDTFSAAFAMGFRRFSEKRAFSYALSSAIAGMAATAMGFLLGWAARRSMSTTTIGLHLHCLWLPVLTCAGRAISTIQMS